MSEKRDRRTPLGTRDGKRARARRVSLRTSSTPTPCSRTTRLSASRRPTHRDRPSRPGLHRPHAPASDRANTVKKVDGAEERRRRLQDQLLTAARASGGRGSWATSAAEGSSKSRKSVHNVTRARHAERLRRKAPARFEDHVPLDLLLRRGGVHSEAHLRRHAWPRHDVRGTRSPRTIARCRGSRPKFDRKRPVARPRGSPSVDLSRRPPRPSSFPATGPPARRLARPRLTSRPTPRRRLSRALDARPVSSRLVRRAPDTPPGAR